METITTGTKYIERVAERTFQTPAFRAGDKVKFMPEYDDHWPVELRYSRRTLSCRGMLGIVQDVSVSPFVLFDGMECAIDQEDLKLMGRKS